MVSEEFVTLGKPFVVQVNRIVVSDPCYDFDASPHILKDKHAHTLKVKPGSAFRGWVGNGHFGIYRMDNGPMEPGDGNKIGMVSVDSGQTAFLVRQMSEGEYEDPNSDYHKACFCTDETDGAGACDGGFVSRTEYGDGAYPLYAKFDKDGYLLSAVIDHDPQSNEDEDEGTCSECGEPTTVYDDLCEPCRLGTGPCRKCKGATDDGEGFDGLCGNCADKTEEE